jgi:Cupin domain
MSLIGKCIRVAAVVFCSGLLVLRHHAWGQVATPEASHPHSHPWAVIGYVVEGTLRTQVKGERESTYKAGESFYEAPNGVHLVSANASSTEPAKLVAYLICDHDTPLSVDVPDSVHQKGAAK